MKRVKNIKYEDALKLCDEEIAELRTRYSLEDNEGYERRLRKAFKKGVHHCFAESVLTFLKQKFGSQAAIAEQLELDDRSGISHKLKHGLIDGPNLTYLLHKFPEIVLPGTGDAANAGYIEAVSWVREIELKDSDYSEKLSHEELTCILEVLSNESWHDAERDGNTMKLRLLAENILKLVEYCPGTRRIKTVAVLEQVVAEWRVAFLLCLWAIPLE